MALAYARALHKQPPPSPPQAGQGRFDQRWSAWGSAFGGSGTYDGNATVGSNNVTASDYGYAAGMDYHVTPDTVYGFALGGGGTNWNLATNLGSGRSDSFEAGVYAKTHWGAAYVSGALGFRQSLVHHQPHRGRRSSLPPTSKARAMRRAAKPATAMACRSPAISSA